MRRRPASGDGLWTERRTLAAVPLQAFQEFRDSLDGIGAGRCVYPNVWGRPERLERANARSTGARRQERPDSAARLRIRERKLDLPVPLRDRLDAHLDRVAQPERAARAAARERR